jgi:hypothetical protein
VILTLIGAFAPFLLQLGLKAVAWFEGDANQKLANQKTFLDLLSSHVNDAQKSVDEKLSYADQVKALEDQSGQPKSGNPPTV